MTTSTYIEDAKCRLNVVQKLNNIRIHVGMIKLEQENGRTVRLCSFLWTTIIVVVHFACTSPWLYYTYNQL